MSKRARKDLSAWEVEEEQAFQSLRSTLASATVLAFPDLDNTFELHTDDSAIGVGALPMQTINGTSRVIAFASTGSPVQIRVEVPPKGSAWECCRL